MQNKIKPQSPEENKEDTYVALVFAPDHSATVVLAQMWTNSNEHSCIIYFYGGQTYVTSELGSNYIRDQTNVTEPPFTTVINCGQI